MSAKVDRFLAENRHASVMIDLREAHPVDPVDPVQIDGGRVAGFSRPDDQDGQDEA
jgi:hypothetical protein